MPTTDREAFEAVFANLTANGIAWVLNLRGSTGVRDWDHRKVKAAINGANRWVSAHVGSDDLGGAHWDRNGKLRENGYCGTDPVDEIFFSFNHEHPDLADRLVALFRAVGIKADWSGSIYDCVVVSL